MGNGRTIIVATVESHIYPIDIDCVDGAGL